MVKVTVRCKGDGLISRPDATVNVPCPTCGAVNQVIFDASGEVRDVTLHGGSTLRFLEPSLN